MRARDLFYGLWIPDLFMKRVKSDDEWTLMCPNECKGLSDVYGNEFEILYEKFEKEKKGRKIIKARKLWESIIESQIETGMPYMVYKDASNLKSNQKNLGTIKCSNLCTEVIEYSDGEEIGVCNLASISLNKLITDDKKTFDFEMLKSVTKIVTRNLNKIIDKNYYYLDETKKSNIKNRPIGIGVQGLADLFFILKLPFDCEEAKKLNKEIFETIYYSALEESCELSKIYGPYDTYENSPISNGFLQFDLWDFKPDSKIDWSDLRNKIKSYGVRNSLLIAPMPTATTAQIFGHCESFEPIHSNFYMRRVVSGEFQVVNKYLLQDLIDQGLWNQDLKDLILLNKGSIQNIDTIDNNLKKIYRTVWEIPQKNLIDMARDRAVFIDQSQSLNLYMESPSYKKITSMHFYAWEKGLKTGMYYLRTMPAAEPIKFSIIKGQKRKLKEYIDDEENDGENDDDKNNKKCKSDNSDETCLSCSL